jgi:hypothetical protein
MRSPSLPLLVFVVSVIGLGQMAQSDDRPGQIVPIVPRERSQKFQTDPHPEGKLVPAPPAAMPPEPLPPREQDLETPPTALPEAPASARELPPAGAIPFLPPRIIHYGWPGLKIYRRDAPLPQPKPTETDLETKSLHPRTSRLEIRTRGPARVFVDGEDVACVDGVYQIEHPRPLIPGTTYMHTIRVEEVDANGREIARTIVVYMRKGRVTELTFE